MLISVKSKEGNQERLFKQILNLNKPILEIIYIFNMYDAASYILCLWGLELCVLSCSTIDIPKYLS